MTHASELALENLVQRLSHLAQERDLQLSTDDHESFYFTDSTGAAILAHVSVKCVSAVAAEIKIWEPGNIHKAQIFVSAIPLEEDFNAAVAMQVLAGILKQ